MKVAFLWVYSFPPDRRLDADSVHNDTDPGRLDTIQGDSPVWTMVDIKMVTTLVECKLNGQNGNGSGKQGEVIPALATLPWLRTEQLVEWRGG